MGESAGLLFQIRSDASDAEANVKRFANTVATDIKAASEEAVHELGTLGKGISALEGPAGIAAIAVAGIGVALFGISEKIFSLAEASATYGKEIFDASTKTGLSAETISALKYAADLSGSSLEQFSKGIVRFTNTMGEAAKGSDSAKEKLKELHVTSKDLDTGVAQMIATIAKAESPIQRTTLATDAFGKKLGAEMIPVIESFKGNLPELMQRLDDLGLLMSGKDAEASEEFHKQLSTLEKQADALGRTFVSTMMPSMTRAMEEISRFMAENKDAAKEWGRTFEETAFGVAYALRTAESYIAIELDNIGVHLRRNSSESQTWADKTIASISRVVLAWTTFGLTEAHNLSPTIFDPSAKFGGTEMELDPATMTLKSVAKPKPPPFNPPAGGGGGGRGKGGKSDAERRAEEDLRAQISIEKIHLQDTEKLYKETLERIRAEFKKTDDEGVFNQAADDAATKYLDNLRAILDVLDKLEVKQLKNPTLHQTEELQLRQKDRRNEIEGTPAKDATKNAEEIEVSNKRQADKIANTFEDLTKKIAAQFDAMYDGMVQDEDDFADDVIARNQVIVEDSKASAAARRAAADTITQTIVDRAAYLTDLATQDRDRQLTDFDIEEKAEKRKVAESIKDEIARQQAIQAIDDLYRNKRAMAETEFQKRLRKITSSSAVPVSGGPATKGGDLLASSKEYLKDLPLDTVNAFAEGIGNIVQNLVLMGEAGPHAFQKLTASILANVAQQCAVLAIKHLAFGIAALTPWGAAEYGPAPLQFQAAALFGSIALGTGLAGRAVAGNSFKNAGSGSGSSVTAIGATGNYNNQQPASRVGAGAYASGPFHTLNQNIQMLHDKLDSMRPGDVLTRGINANRGIIGQQTLKDIKSGHVNGKDILSASGLR